MEEYFEDLSTTGTHKRRYAKMTLYLEVPSLDANNECFMEPDEICALIENNLPDGVITTSYSDILLSPIESDDFHNFKSPVGYLTPDGKFFLIETTEDGLAHIKLSYRVYQLYEKLVDSVLGMSLENRLENTGFIKVHGTSVRYFANMPYDSYYGDTTERKSPKIGDALQEKIINYLIYVCRRERTSLASINDHLVKLSDLKKMDNIQFNKVFEF